LEELKNELESGRIRLKKLTSYRRLDKRPGNGNENKNNYISGDRRSDNNKENDLKKNRNYGPEDGYGLNESYRMKQLFY